MLLPVVCRGTSAGARRDCTDLGRGEGGQELGGPPEDVAELRGPLREGGHGGVRPAARVPAAHPVDEARLPAAGVVRDRLRKNILSQIFFKLLLFRTFSVAPIRAQRQHMAST